MLDLKPIHLDTITDSNQNELGEKTQKKQKHGRTVQWDIGGLGWDFAETQTDDNNFGISESASVQFALQWEAPFFLDTVDAFTLVSMAPKLHLNVLGDFKFTIHVGFFELTFSINMYPFKFTPFDILYRIDALHPSRFCTGMDWQVRTFLAELMVEWRAKECHYGLFGILTDNDESDCIWRNYVPQLPLFELLWDTVGNMEGSYIETACSNWYSAAWENFPITEEYLQTFDVERPSGDSNQERTEEDDEAIDQIADEEGKRIDEEENENATDDDEKIEIF